MDHVPRGTTGVRVSRLCFGTMTFARECDEAASAALYRRCREAGITTFDCANVYAGGASEEVLGRLVRGERDELVLTSKAYFPTGPGPNERGASRRHLLLACEASLRRLGTDRIDLYFVHRFDDETRIEDTLRALDDLVRQGKIVYPAASNFAAWQVMKCLGIQALRGYVPFACIQPMYSLVKRVAEIELLPLALAEGLGVLPYSPLGGGLLTGKYTRRGDRAEARLDVDGVYRERYGDPADAAVAEGLAELARRRGIESAALAVAWVASHPAVTAPLIGARSVEQLEIVLGALDVDMTELRAELDALGPPPPLATDRSEERAGVRYGGALPAGDAL